MKIVDLNLLIYAVNENAALHARARRWWEETLSGEEQVGLAWVVVLGFLRLCTRSGIFPKPLSTAQALRVVDEWLQRPPCVVAHPGERHWVILQDLLRGTGTAANLTTDAHLAALAIEHEATLCSTDADFARFSGIRYTNPLA